MGTTKTKYIRERMRAGLELAQRYTSPHFCSKHIGDCRGPATKSSGAAPSGFKNLDNAPRVYEVASMLAADTQIVNQIKMCRLGEVGAVAERGA